MLQTAVLLAFIATLQIAYAWTGDELVQAVTDNDLNKLAVILGEKTHPDVTDKVGWTGLLTASRTSNIAAAQRLIAAGANVNVAETDGWTPLHFCVALNNAQMCKVLIDGGANILLKNKNGQFPLAAVEEGHNEELKRIFADALSRNSNQRQQQAPPAAAAKLPSYDEVFKQVRQGNLLAFNEAVSTFRSTNTPFDFNHKDAAGFTLAHCICAATPVNPEMFKFLMSGRSSANLNHQENDGWTALMFLAVHVGNPVLSLRVLCPLESL
jgi:ankyrin repeat protein